MSSDTAAKKRSRSPSDEIPQKQHKRANTGTSPGADDSAEFVSQSRSGPMMHDVSMVDANIPIKPEPDLPSSVPVAGPAPPSGLPVKTEVDVDVAGNNVSATASSNASSPAVAVGAQASTSASSAGNKSTAGTSSAGSGGTSAQIHMRCLIVTQDASIIIGKGGSHVNEIREKSGARVMVSESIPGNPERILNVSGPLDAVSKVCFKGILSPDHPDSML